MDSFSEAVNCLCANVIPLTYNSNKESVPVLFCLRIRYFKALCMIDWNLFHNTCCMEVRLYVSYS